MSTEVPSTMRAVRLVTDGGPDALAIEEIETPRPKAGEALVQVDAAAITRDELTWPVDRLPATPSYELAGVVADVAPDVDDVAVGDRVFALTPFDRDGVAAGFATVPANLLVATPQTLEPVESAAVPMPALSAWQGMFVHGGLEAGQRVLISGASGGVGHLAVQLAHHRGAHVIAIASGDRADDVRRAGADEVIDRAASTGSIPWTSCSTRPAATSSRAPPRSSAEAARSCRSPKSRRAGSTPCTSSSSPTVRSSSGCAGSSTTARCDRRSIRCSRSTTPARRSSGAWLPASAGRWCSVSPGSRQEAKAVAFRALHAGEPFMIPNPWDAGSARVLAALGFAALATTSSGFAFTLGRRDGGVTLDEVVDHVASVDGATDLPVSVDLENGYGADPESVARAIRRVAAAGAVGGSIEDYDRDGFLYEQRPAAERIAAAAEAARGLGFPFTLTARAENHIRGNPDLDDTIARLRAYAAAGADVLFAPGLRTVEEIRAVCAAVSEPVNVLAVPEPVVRPRSRRRAHNA